ncbi:hypothetical protein PC116_g17872 [Phytophthora cactorum]|uniref:Uncharacterized protein n=1 Tax=Phytophthora cactorum TaxID=29920 RepID=A0A8T1B3U0_9STRA|nr:hypothetical protein PC114_g23957 [Phytophthora cactorum]KAG2893365.1 hypothetical protein PC117_g23792 [Phytophthora cactorum]KAG2998577.1 hypothetical protein PC120_g21122 [Phytophthora cactorum]KAG3129250.1 hypothetical protein C6341_g24203 [Phytophthora cactorum]KAG3152925.1 hypothetical protein PC128_g22676 [Phytophthora cactorum]
MQRTSEPRQYENLYAALSSARLESTAGASALVHAPRYGAGRQTSNERRRASATSTTYTRRPRSGVRTSTVTGRLPIKRAEAWADYWTRMASRREFSWCLSLQ